MKRYLYLTIVVVMAGLLAACTYEEGDEPPRKTNGEYAVYSCVYRAYGAAMPDLRIAVGLNAYLAQTTDAGRKVVAARFFPWARIIVQTETGWRLKKNELGDECYDFVIKDGILLGEPGASWQCYRCDSSGALMICDLSYEAGKIAYKGFPYSGCRIDWLVDVTLTNDDLSMSLAGGHKFEYKSDWYMSEVWMIDCHIDTPLQWSDCTGGVIAGVSSVTAMLSGVTPRTIAFQTEHIGDGLKITTEDGRSELWRWTD